MKRFYSFFILLVACLMTANLQAGELTVCDGTANSSKVPFDGYNADGAQHNQLIFPASDLAAMNGNNISQMVFYIDGYANNTSTESYRTAERMGTWTVSLGETEATTLNGLDNSTALTQVYQGYFDCSTGTLTLTFNDEYLYHGGNLLVDLNHAAAGWCTWYFLGVAQSANTAITKGSAYQFLPKTTFTFTAPPACPKPAGVTVSDIDEKSAKLSWTQSGSVSEWKIRLNEDDNNITTAQSNEDVELSLEPLHNYTVEVRAICSETEQSEWSSPVSFTTKAEPVDVGLFWMDDFEDEFGWQLINGTCTNAWTLGTAAHNAEDEDHALYISNDGGTTNAYTNNSDAMVYATKLLIFEDGKYQFTYDWRAYGESSSDYLRVALVPATVTLTAGTSAPSGFTTSGLPTGWIALDGGSKLNLSSEWQTKNQAIEVTAGNYYLTVAWRDDYSAGTNPPAAVDNFFIQKLACAYEVEGLAVAEEPAITTTTAAITWTANEDVPQWEVQYSLSSSFPEDGIESVEANGNSAELEELNPSTTYYVRVRAVCDADNEEFGSWSEAISFHTACAAFEAAAWTDGFEDGIYCWNVGNFNAPTNTSYIPSVVTTAHNGSKALKIQAYRYSTTTNADSAYAVLPQMDFGAKGLAGHTLKFYACQTSATSSYADYYEHLLIGVVDDPADLSTFTQVADVQITGTNYAAYEVLLNNYTGSGEYLVLLAVTNPTVSTYSRYGSFYVDDIALEVTPACQPLASISLSNVQRRSMVVNLQPKAGMELGVYDLVYSTTALNEAALNAAEKTSVSSATYTIDGLERETKYYVYVRANCGSDGISAWVSAEATTKGLSGCNDIALGSGSVGSSTLPTHSNYDFSLSEQIYTAAEIGEAGNISSIAFYNSGSTKTRTLDVYMLHTDKAEFESATDWVTVAESDKVFSDDVTFTAGAWVTLELTTPFAYNGTDNILLVVDDNTDSYSSGLSCLTYTTANYEALSKYQDNTDINPKATVSVTGTQSYSKNQIKFTFCYSNVACPAVSDLAFELVDEGTTKANVSWNISDVDYLSGFDVILSENEITNFDGVEPTHASIADSHINFTTLSAGTHYYVYVRAICQAESHNDGNSTWAGIDFTTNADCPAVFNLSAELTATNAVHVAWDKAYADQALHFQYVLSEAELDDDALEAASPVSVDNATSIDFENLEYEKDYHIYVASKCGNAHSAYVHASFTTVASCQAVENLAATRTKHNLVEIAWTSAEFATETQWEVSVVGDNNKKQIVSERKAIIFGLQPATDYTIQVKAKCAENESSAAASLEIHTADQPGACVQVGDGTTNGNMPVTNYNYAYTQMIYAKDLISNSGKIQSLVFKRSSYANEMNDMKVYLGTTDKETFSSSSDWIAEDDLTLVYEGDFPAGTASDPDLMLDINAKNFNFDGMKNLVVAVSNGHGNWNSIQNFYYTSAEGTVLYSRDDYDASYANHPGTAAGQSVTNSRTNIEFCFEDKACPNVTAMAASNITTSEATVSWEPKGSEIAWNILISESANVTDFNGAELVSTLSKHFTGLTDDTDYFVYVQPNGCDGAEFNMFSFHTVASCLPMLSPVVDDESITKNSATVSWTDPNEVPAGQYTVAYGPFDDFDLDDASTYEIVNATEASAEISGLTPQTKYAFAVKANCGGNDPSRWSIVADFTTAIACYAPTNPKAESTTAHSAVLSWTDEHDAAAYIIAYGLYSSFNINDPETYTLVNAPTNPFTLNNLEAATNYRFLVKGDCSSVGDGESKSWSSYASFQTECEAEEIPYNEDFNSSSALTCWIKGNMDGNTSYVPYLSSNSLYLNAYKNVSTYSASYNVDADGAYAVLPVLNFGDEGIVAHQIRFKAKANNGSYSSYSYYKHIIIGIAEDADLTNMEIVADQELTDEYDEYEISFESYTGEGNRIVLLAKVDPESTANTRYAQVYVDDVNVSHIASCKRVASLEAEVLSGTSAQMTWVAAEGQTSFQYVCVRAGETPNWIGVEPVEYTDVTLDTLKIDNDYEFYVRAYCDAATQSESRMVEFHIGYCVPAPTSIDGDGIIAIAFNNVEVEASHPEDAPFYADNSDILLQASVGSRDSIQITYNTGYTYGTVIWVDWDGNLTFDADEVVFAGTSLGTKPTIFNCPFAIPENAAVGIYRLRIGAGDSYFDNYISYPGSYTADPCGTGTYSIYEDYSLKVVSTATGIDNTVDGMQIIKRIENGLLLIEVNGVIYNAQGQVVTK